MNRLQRDLDVKNYSSSSLRDTVMRFWIHRRSKLIHDYSLVGYILSPNPIIMAHAFQNQTPVHIQVAENLLTKLLLLPNLTGNERNIARAELIDSFMEEYGDFKNKRGIFSHDNIWIIAAKDDCKAFCWHQKYSLNTTKVVGKLACFVLSKILGIGMAERNWKQVKAVKAVKSGQRTNTTMEKTKNQVLIYAQYQQLRAKA